MKMSASAVYKLEIGSNKRNVFVTQLHDHEDDDDIKEFPVVKESGDRLIETGINTLQKTLLLKKEVEVEKVDSELEAKRSEFRQRMERCRQRKLELQKKQQQMQDRVTKFEKFIEENDSKRQRAIQKYQLEVRQKEQKALEFSSISEQLQYFKVRHKMLQERLRRYKMYEDYLHHVVEALPEDYLPPSEDKIKSLMMRHRTLSESNQTLVHNLDAMADELEELKRTLDESSRQHQQFQLSSTSQIAQLQEWQENLRLKNEQQELSLAMNKDEERSKLTEVGLTCMAIDNLYEKCRKPADLQFNMADWDLKLSRIQGHVQDRDGVLHLVLTSAGSDSALAGSAPRVKWSGLKVKTDSSTHK